MLMIAMAREVRYGSASDLLLVSDGQLPRVDVQGGDTARVRQASS